MNNLIIFRSLKEELEIIKDFSVDFFYINQEYSSYDLLNIIHEYSLELSNIINNSSSAFKEDIISIIFNMNLIINNDKPLLKLIKDYEEPLLKIIEEPLLEIIEEPLLEILKDYEEPLIEILKDYEEPLLKIIEEPLIEILKDYEELKLIKDYEEPQIKLINNIQKFKIELLINNKEHQLEIIQEPQMKFINNNEKQLIKLLKDNKEYLYEIKEDYINEDYIRNDETYKKIIMTTILNLSKNKNIQKTKFN